MIVFFIVFPVVVQFRLRLCYSPFSFVLFDCSFTVLPVLFLLLIKRISWLSLSLSRLTILIFSLLEHLISLPSPRFARFYYCCSFGFGLSRQLRLFKCMQGSTANPRPLNAMCRPAAALVLVFFALCLTDHFLHPFFTDRQLGFVA